MNMINTNTCSFHLIVTYYEACCVHKPQQSPKAGVIMSYFIMKSEAPAGLINLLTNFLLFNSRSDIQIQICLLHGLPVTFLLNYVDVPSNYGLLIIAGSKQKS